MNWLREDTGKSLVNKVWGEQSDQRASWSPAKGKRGQSAAALSRPPSVNAVVKHVWAQRGPAPLRPLTRRHAVDVVPSFMQRWEETSQQGQNLNRHPKGFFLFVLPAGSCVMWHDTGQRLLPKLSVSTGSACCVWGAGCNHTDPHFSPPYPPLTFSFISTQIRLCRPQIFLEETGWFKMNCIIQSTGLRLCLSIATRVKWSQYY